MRKFSSQKIRATSSGPENETRERVCLMSLIPNYLYISFSGFPLVRATVLAKN